MLSDILGCSAWCPHKVALRADPRCPSTCWATEGLSFLTLYSLPPTPQDVKRCLNALEELGTLQVTSHILQKNTDVVATLKKVGGAGGWRVLAGPGLLRASSFLAGGWAGGSASVQGRGRGDGRHRERLGPGGEASGAS